MKNNYLVKQVFLVAVSGLAIFSFFTNALAAESRNRSEHRQRRVQEHWRGRRQEVSFRNQRYTYRDGRFFRKGVFGFEFLVNAAPIGIIVANLPFGNQTVVVRGRTYHHYNNIYYERCPSGYIVVEKPAIHQLRFFYSR